MNKKRIFTAIAVIGLFTATYSQTTPNPFPPGNNPDRIVLNVTQDPSTSIAITWRTCDTVKTGYVEILENSAHPADIAKAKKHTAKSEFFRLDSLTAMYHSAVISNLQPNTSYMYRVGTGNYWSEWFHTKTAGIAGDKLSFIYFGDVQAGIKTLWSRVIRDAYSKMPDARTILYAGDIINNAEFDYQWGELFYGGSYIHSMVPGIMSPGNHEYKTRDDSISPFWKPQFTLPDNGPGGLKETVYYTDIQGMRFISLNSNQAEESPKDLESQKVWLEEVLKNNPNKWTCVLFHHPIYSISPRRDNPWMRDAFKPLFDKYKVDLVMQGHDHAYARGMKKIPLGSNGPKFSGTMYIVSVSGSKMYEENQKPWMDKWGGHTQLYQLITVENNKLTYKCYTAAGDLYDTFELIKRKGKKNKLKEFTIKSKDQALNPKQ